MKAFLIFIFLLNQSSWAIDTSEDLHVKETGQMFVVKIIPGSKQTEIFITGKKVLNIDVSTLQVKGQYMANGEKKLFKLTPYKDHFITREDITGRELELQIKAPAEKVEVINVDLKKK